MSVNMTAAVNHRPHVATIWINICPFVKIIGSKRWGITYKYGKPLWDFKSRDEKDKVQQRTVAPLLLKDKDTSHPSGI